jgi:hypothetical protein
MVRSCGECLESSKSPARFIQALPYIKNTYSASSSMVDPNHSPRTRIHVRVLFILSLLHLARPTKLHTSVGCSSAFVFLLVAVC